MVASGGVLSEGYGPGGPGVCLRDGQTEAYPKGTGEGLSLQCGRGEALLLCMPSHLILPDHAQTMQRTKDRMWELIFLRTVFSFNYA